MSLRIFYLQFLRTGRKTWWGWPLFQVLKVLSFLYRLGWRVRKTASGLFPKKKLSCPVISVGNLTAGGAGKTPLVIHLAETFISEGKRVAVLSRGYGRRDEDSLTWVSDGKSLLASPEEGGDEPVLIARRVPKAAVLSCADRYRAGREAVEKFKPDIILLDDGFQRRFTLHRDLDLLVLDGADPFSTGHLFPAGLLREPLEVLREAGVIVLNKMELSSDPKGLRSLLGTLFPQVPLVEARYRSVGLRDLHTGRSLPSSRLRKAALGAFCGIADPRSFLGSLKSLGLRVERTYAFADHFAYTTTTLEAILRDAKKRGFRALVTTEKDAAKLPKVSKTSLPVLVLGIEVVFSNGKKQLRKALKEAVTKA